jgi:hypothetical protein
VPLLVHITNEDETESVRRSGIKIGKYRDGVYAMPVSQNFIVSNQWLRELKRRGIWLTQVVGWRYHPNARQQHVRLPCLFACGHVQVAHLSGAVLRQGLRRLEWLGISVPNRSFRRSSTG